jgi:hypothetical protein
MLKETPQLRKYPVFWTALKCLVSTGNFMYLLSFVVNMHNVSVLA